jgi:hypothetical protein
MSIVYILTNESMPDYIKIGRTDREVTKRVLELDNTAVPLPFQCYYAAEVSDYQKVERALHIAFDDFRVRKNREFFRNLDPYRVKVILELLADREVTPRVDVTLDDDAGRALERVVSHARRFSFASAAIPIGATLTFSRDSTRTCIVESDSSVVYEGQSLSISRAAIRAMQEMGYKTQTLAGGWYWLYEDETLNSRRARLSQEDADE